MSKMTKRAELAVFNDLKKELKRWDIDNVSDAAGYHRSTLYNWLNGKTKNPFIHTVIDVAKVIGFEVRLVRTRAHLKRVA